MVRFAGLLVALLAVTGWILSIGFKTDADRHAILVSASLAGAVQLAMLLESYLISNAS